MKITACCPTCNRPEMLGRIVKCFERQTHEDRELIILDDLGQYDSQSGDRWTLISFKHRFRSLGEKRNALVGLATGDAIAVWDDDDFYYPWALQALAESLEQNEVVMPRLAIDFHKGKRVCVETFRVRPGQPLTCNAFAFHGCWGYTRDVFNRAGRYASEDVLDDSTLKTAFAKMRIKPADISHKPFYVYNRNFPGTRLSNAPHDPKTRNRISKGARFYGIFPEWTDETDWEIPVPDAIIKRPW